MAIQSQPTRIPEPFAGSGTKNTIPATNATPSASQAASWASGFPPECSQPISAGGCPVPRDDVNGALNQLSQDFAFRQDGGVWAWSALADYDSQRVVRGSDGLLYWSVAQSGPGTGAGAVDPTTDDGTYWTAPQTATAPIGDNSSKIATTHWVYNRWDAYKVNRDLYVDSINGNDGNDGLTAGTAFKTVEHAYTLIASGDYGYFTGPFYTIHVAKGSYGQLQAIPGCNISYIATSSGEDTTCAGAEASQSSEVIYLSGTWIFDGGDIRALNGGTVQISGSSTFHFKNQSSQCMWANTCGSLVFENTASIYIWFGTNVNPSNAALRCSDNGVIRLYGVSSMSGSNSGKKYSVTNGGRIVGAGSTNIPGTGQTIDSQSTFN